MVKQFPNVNALYGAPMGRPSVGDLDQKPRSIRLFKVRIDSQGYDDGGAYWGHGAPLWCAEDADGDQRFTRAHRRERAAFELGIHPASLKRPLADLHGYCLALFDGRAPYPAGKEKADVFTWLDGVTP